MSHKYFSLIFAGILSLSLGGCGYTFQTSRSPLFLKEGIRRIYIAPIVNNTFKAGIENVVYNDLVRYLTAQGRVMIVQNPNDADATLTGSVALASYSANASSIVAAMRPTSVAQMLANMGTVNGTNMGNFPIASEYMATLSCSFSLSGRPNLTPGVEIENSVQSSEKAPARPRLSRPYVWSSGFTQNKAFPASNQLDVPRTTSPLINDTEFERALGDLSRSMVIDIHESMLSMF